MDQYDYLSDGLAPGDKVKAIEQCQKAFGSKFVPHVKPGEKPFEVSGHVHVVAFPCPFKITLSQDLCRELWCANSTHALRAHPALEGTDCSSKPYPYGSVSQD